MGFHLAPEEQLTPMLEVEIVASNSAVFCIPRGNLDATTVATFRGAVALCLGGPGLVIDLSGVPFMDGAGLTALVGAVRRAQDQRTRVAVVVPAGTLHRVLVEAGLDLIVSVSETVDLALAEMCDSANDVKGVCSHGKCEELVRSTRRDGG